MAAPGAILISKIILPQSEKINSITIFLIMMLDQIYWMQFQMELLKE